MKLTLEERIDAYLEGELSADECSVFERDLLLPEVSEAFGRELFVREFLQNMGPSEVPEGLVQQIEEALEVEARESKRRRGLFESPALLGAGWILRGPAMAFNGPRNGLSNARFALGPLAGGGGVSQRAKEQAKARAKEAGSSLGKKAALMAARQTGKMLFPPQDKKPSLWRRALSWWKKR